MEYRPSFPAKNISQKGHKGRFPLVKNKKATFGKRWYGVLWTLGAMDAHQNSSSAVMLCITLFGMKKPIAPTCGGGDCVGGGNGGDGIGCRGGGGDDTGGSGNGGNGVGEGTDGTKGRWKFGNFESEIMPRKNPKEKRRNIGTTSRSFLPK
jgi:hypothetical protein